MDAITSILPILQAGTAGAGLFGNVMNSITRGKEVGNLQTAEKKFASMTPEQLSGLVSRATQPLSAGLTQSVGNQVQADMAGRGLAEAPGVYAATESQALAPYELQQQQMALQLVMKQLGLPIEYAQAILQGTGGNVDTSKMLAMLMNAQKGNQVPGTPAGGTDEFDSLLQSIISSGVPTPTPPSTGVGTGTGGGVD